MIVNNVENFRSEEEAISHMQTHVFEPISSYVRLYKTAQTRQDEYMLIRALNPAAEDQFVPSVYRLDRDITDMLVSAGIPDKVAYPTLNAQGNAVKRRISVLPAWRRDPAVQAGRLTGLCYLPNGATVVDGKLNMYKDVSVVATGPGDEHSVKEILHHIRHNICNGQPEYANYFVRWLAHLVQFPQVRPKTAVAIIGDQGTGKGVLMDFLKLMLGGERNCNTTASSTDTKAFNYALANKLLVGFDEATFAGDRSQSDFMKKLVTEPKIRVEQKGVDPYEVDNFTRVIITSNNMSSAVPAGVGARRWLTMECRNGIDGAELRLLANIIGNNGAVQGADLLYAGKFKAYLAAICLDDFNPLDLPAQDTGFENKLNVLYREDPLKAFFWEWLMADKLTLYRSVEWRDKDTGRPVESDVALCWDREVLFADFYAVFAEHCEATHVKPPAQNRIRKLLEPFSATTTNGSGNTRYVSLPAPSVCLEILHKSSRFDRPISAEQGAFIASAWLDRSDDAKAKRRRLRMADDLDDMTATASRIVIDGFGFNINTISEVESERKGEEEGGGTSI